MPVMLDESIEHSLNTTPVAVWIDVDAGIASLIRVLNQIEGLRTMASCQGHRRSMYECRAHVMLWHRDGDPFWEWLDSEMCGRWEKLPFNWEIIRDQGSKRADLYVDPDGIESMAAVLREIAQSP